MIKARLIILGNTQAKGLDFTETFALVVKMVTIRILLFIAFAWNWSVHQMDVHNAFLYGDLMEKMYMQPPLGFHTSSLVWCVIWKNLSIDFDRLPYAGFLNFRCIM